MMIRRIVSCRALVAAGVLFVASTAAAQPIPSTGGTKPATPKPAGTSPTTSGTSPNLKTPIPTTGSPAAGGPATGGTTTGGTGFDFGALLPPEMELQVMLEAVVLTELLAQANGMQFASELDALFFFLEVYAWRYAAAQQALMTGGGSSATGPGGNGVLNTPIPTGGTGGAGTTRP